MSLAPLLQPAPDARPAVRARFQQIAATLQPVGNQLDLSPNAARLHETWLALLPHATGVRTPPAGWLNRLAAQFSSATALECAESTKLLRAYGLHLSDPDFVTASEFIDTLHTGRLAADAAHAALPQVSSLAQEICQPARELFGRARPGPTAPDFATLQRDLAAWLEAWLHSAQNDGPDRAVLSALAAFPAHVLARHSLPERGWRFLLQRLAAQPTLEPLGVAMLAEALQAARLRFPLLASLSSAWSATPALAGPDHAPWRALLELHLLLGAAPESELARQAAQHLQVAPINRGLQMSGPTYRAARASLLAASDAAARDSLATALAAAETWVEGVARAALDATELHRGAGNALPESQTATHAARLAADLRVAARELASLSLSPAHTATLVRHFLVADLGADPTKREWTSPEGVAGRLEETSAAPLPAAPTSGPSHFLADVRAHLAALAPWSIATNRQLLRANFVPDPRLFATAADRVAARDLTESVLIRLCVAGRLSRPGLTRLDVDLPEENWNHTARAVASRQPTPLGAAFHRLAAEAPRLLLAARLARIAAAAAEESVQQLESLFPAARTARSRHVQDNFLLLRALADALRSSGGDAGDTFTRWWRAELQPFSAELPVEFAAANCSALRQALAPRLDPAALERAMALVETAFRASLDESPAPLAPFDEATPAHLGAHLHQRVARVEPSGADLRLDMLQRLALLGGDQAGLTAGFERWFAEAIRELSSASHPAAAVAALRFSLTRFATDAGTPRAAQTLALLAAQSTRHAPGPRSDTPWPAWTALAALSLQALEQDQLAAALHPGWIARAELPAPEGVAEPVLGALHSCLVRQLRTAAPDLGAINTARFALEQLAPALAFPAEVWRDAFAAWHRTQVERCPPPAQPLLAEFAALLAELAPLLARTHPVALQSFDPRARFLGPDLQADRPLRHAFGLALLAETGPGEGRLSRPVLLRCGWQHVPGDMGQLQSLLLAHADRLFGMVPPDDYFWVLDQIEATRAAAPGWLAPNIVTNLELTGLARSLAEFSPSAAPRTALSRLRPSPAPNLAPDFARAEAAIALTARRGDLSLAAALGVTRYVECHLPRELSATLPAARAELHAALGPAAELFTLDAAPLAVAHA